jgi:outer membrane cobalamin receptor
MIRIFFSIIMIAVLSAGFVYADTDENTDVDLEKIVVTPTRMGQYDYDTTSNVTIIGSKEIKASHTKNIPEVLIEKAGLNIYNNSSDKTNRVDIRGFADTSITNILVIGCRYLLNQ